MALDLWAAARRVPGDCADEARVVDGKHSFCAPWGCWTNCRQMGHCTMESFGAAARNITESEEED